MGSGPSDSAPAVSLSTYHVCKLTGQQRADEIFAEVYAPKLNELVEKGDITGWNWNEHRLGGRYRRLADDYRTRPRQRRRCKWSGHSGYANENHSALAAGVQRYLRLSYRLSCGTSGLLEDEVDIHPGAPVGAPFFYVPYVVCKAINLPDELIGAAVATRSRYVSEISRAAFRKVIERHIPFCANSTSIS